MERALANAAKPVLSIGAVSQLTHLSARQIRYYEQYGLLRPHRSKGKQRIYSGMDVERLMLVRELLSQGIGLSDIAELFSAACEEGAREYWLEVLPDTSSLLIDSDLMDRIKRYEEQNPKC